ncbi:response regulator [Candidatus Giovannonibacteria bacterium]|nr:response regulator [Candidatus Giovannonibacteria bacterium]
MEQKVKKVIIIEDNERILGLYCRWARSLGYEVDSANEGHEALEKINRNIYDIAIVDWRLPGISGIELGFMMLNIVDPPIVRVCITGSSNISGKRYRSDNAGYDYFIQKPIELLDFLSMLRKADKHVEDRKRLESYKKDFTTGLLTKEVTTERIDHLNNSKEITAVIILDGDNFGQINKKHGEIIGDLVLRCAADRIRNAVYRVGNGIEKDIGRWGDKADTILIVANPANQEILRKIGEGILETFRNPIHVRSEKYEVKGLLISYSVSIGGALTGPGISPMLAVRHANAAMIFVKEHGKKGFEIFDTNKHSFLNTA